MADLSELLCTHVMTIIICSIASHRTRLLENTSAVAVMGCKERKDLRLYPNTSRKHVHLPADLLLCEKPGNMGLYLL